MHVAAADAGELDVDNNIVRVGDGGNGAVFEFDGVRLLEHEGEVLQEKGLVLYGRQVFFNASTCSFLLLAVCDCNPCVCPVEGYHGGALGGGGLTSAPMVAMCVVFAG